MKTNGNQRTQMNGAVADRREISEWSVGERSEPTRNEEISRRKNRGEEGAVETEVSPPRQRRRFPSAYKARIVREADACLKAGEVGALLRREGLYSSQLTAWRKLYRQGAQKALVEKRGRKPLRTELEKENDRLRKQLAHAQQDLQRAHLIIEVQKKISGILGIAQPPLERDEDE